MEKNYFNSYCINLSKIRISKNISSHELSGRIGKSRAYINKVENGKVNVSLKTMIDIAECLETPLEDFFK